MTRLRIFMACIVAGFFLGWGDAQAHEHWVDVSDFYPSKGDTVAVHVCSGHYFPKSAIVLKDKVLEGFHLWGPEQEPVDVETVAGEKRRSGVVVIEGEGVHVLEFSLRRPRAPEPSFEAKSLVVVNAEKDHWAGYGLGRGLELIPEKAISGLKVGDQLPIFVALDGKRVGASLEVLVEKGKASFLKSKSDHSAIVRIRKTGRYLVMASVRGRGCSLVFEVRATEGGEP